MQHSTGSTNCIQPTRLRTAHHSQLETRCSIGPKRGIMTICTRVQEDCCLTKQLNWETRTCLPMLSGNSFLETIRGWEVSVAISIYRWSVLWLLTPCWVFHASELPLLFGPIPTPVEETFANQMLEFYINFVHDLNPGGVSTDSRDTTISWRSFLGNWPAFDTKTKQVLQLMRDNITAIPDGRHMLSPPTQKTQN